MVVCASQHRLGSMDGRGRVPTNTSMTVCMVLTPEKRVGSEGVGMKDVVHIPVNVRAYALEVMARDKKGQC